ncbi:LysR family transcriptional regulator [Poseidonocella sp. HB161398]|uniref:LysR family transcriptional regulator n=1 Tax=Poseidonocella sp. HB161398 TaxID=2320855 RepID=UPI001108E558|nr:LysR family transcriptional regulator [Poseidonocella sp. HB161398]
MKTDSENTNFSLRHLRAVHAIWAEGSFARAADRLGVVPSALSETVRQLEELAGGALFDRRSRPPEPTTLGLGFLEETRPLLAELDGAVRQLRARARGLEGRLRIGAAPSAVSPLVAPALAAFRRRHPAIEVTLHDDIAEELARRVASGALDLAIAGRARSSPDLEQREIDADRFGLACHRDHPLAQRGGPVALEEIRAEELIHLDADTGTARLLAECPALPARLASGPVRCHSTIAQLCLVRAGAGIAILPREAALLFGDPRICLLEIAGLALERRLYLLLPKRAAPGAPVAAFLDELARQHGMGPSG